MWEEAEMFLSKDKYIAPLVKKYGRCTLKPHPKKYYFEDLVDAIVQQQLSMKAASAIFNRTKTAISDKQKTISSKQKSVNCRHKWRAEATGETIITPENITFLSDEELRSCGLSRPKIIYVRDLTEKVSCGKCHVSRMGGLSDEKIVEELTKVKGIGEWTAQMFLMFTLGRPDVFPSGDLGLRNAFDKAVKKGLNRREMEAFALRWKPYRTISSWYIWKALGD